MGTTKTTSTKLPRGSSLTQPPVRARKHIDTVNSLLAEEHYGKYLVVKNSPSDRFNHNRFYLHHEAMLEFLEASEVNPSLIEILRSNDIASTHLISLFPEWQDIIVTTLHALVDDGRSRNSVKCLLEGFSHLLKVSKKLNITLIACQTTR